jgi:hypothetical protein
MTKSRHQECPLSKRNTRCTRSAVNGPQAGFADPLPAGEYARKVPVCTQPVVPRLVELAERDPSAKVQAKAKAVVAEINPHVKELTR